jgi:hypothetical protein
MANYLPHFAKAWRRHMLMADQNVLLNTITNSHNFNFTNIVLPSLRLRFLSTWTYLTYLQYLLDHF